jgi:hypothetical protein
MRPSWPSLSAVTVCRRPHCHCQPIEASSPPQLDGITICYLGGGKDRSEYQAVNSALISYGATIHDIELTVTTAALAEADTLIVFDYQFYQASEADRQLIADWAAAGGSMFIETESFSNALNPVLSALNLGLTASFVSRSN